jgi:uncharacterized protein
MNKTPFAHRHLFWFVIMLEVAVILAYLLAGTLAHVMGLSNLTMMLMANLSLSVLAAILLSLLGWWKLVGFAAPKKRTELWYFAVPFLPTVPFFPSIVTLIANLEFSIQPTVVNILLLTLLIAFAEETIFRGLMLTTLKARGSWTAVIVSSVLFGLSHSLNLLSGQGLAETAVQVLFALTTGFLFASLVLQKGILWPLIVAHFLIDFLPMSLIGNLSFPVSPTWNLILLTGISVVFLIYGLFVMLENRRQKKLPDLARLPV